KSPGSDVIGAFFNRVSAWFVGLRCANPTYGCATVRAAPAISPYNSPGVLSATRHMPLGLAQRNATRPQLPPLTPKHPPHRPFQSSPAQSPLSCSIISLIQSNHIPPFNHPFLFPPYKRHAQKSPGIAVRAKGVVEGASTPSHEELQGFEEAQYVLFL